MADGRGTLASKTVLAVAAGAANVEARAAGFDGVGRGGGGSLGECGGREERGDR